jgi:Zn-dependent protease
MSEPEPQSHDRLPVLEVASGAGSIGIPPAVEQYRPPRRMVLLPALLFLATCVTTYEVGGPWYAVPLMVTLLAHEFGHFIQAVRYRVPASLPFFIPFRGSPLGTMGAVIVFRGNMGDRKALFDIGISGPLAGLVPAVIFSVVGLHLSKVISLAGHGGEYIFGDSLLFSWLSRLVVGPIPPGYDVELHPLAHAGWVGLLITALNLVPIGQLDGGHILYALLRKKAHVIAQLLLVGAVIYMMWYQNWSYFLLVVLLAVFGVRHPPTANDGVPLGAGRIVLGWLTLLFIVIGFTPQPFSQLPPQPSSPPGPDYVLRSGPADPLGVSPAGGQTPRPSWPASCDRPGRPITIGALVR